MMPDRKALKEMLELGMKISIHFLKPSQGINPSQRWINTVDKITRLGLFERIQQIAWFFFSRLIHWTAIYPVDSVIQLLNNWGQIFKFSARSAFRFLCPGLARDPLTLYDVTRALCYSENTDVAY